MEPKLRNYRAAGGGKRVPRGAGFTLIELMVAIGIFSMVLIIVVGAISAVIDANKKAQTLTSVVNNLNFTLESMTREIKTGTNLAVGGGAECGESVSLTDARGREVAYSRAGDAVLFSVGGGAASPITAPEIIVDQLRFCKLAGDQSAVLFTVSGWMQLGAASSRSAFSIQTTVAQRALNIPT